MRKMFTSRFIFSGIMSFCMAILMSAWVTFINIGISPDYIYYWLRAFILAWPVGFLVVILIAPTVQKLTTIILNKLV